MGTSAAITSEKEGLWRRRTRPRFREGRLQRVPMATEQAMARCPGTHRRKRRWDPAWVPAFAHWR
jgi:hypothetical protein